MKNQIKGEKELSGRVTPKSVPQAFQERFRRDLELVELLADQKAEALGANKKTRETMRSLAREAYEVAFKVEKRS